MKRSTTSVLLRAARFSSRAPVVAVILHAFTRTAPADSPGDPLAIGGIYFCIILSGFVLAVHALFSIQKRRRTRRSNKTIHWAGLTILLLSAIPTFGDDIQYVPIEKLGREFELIGKLHAPLGSVISVVGVAVEGPRKGYEWGPNLRVQRIQGRYYQKDIQILLVPYFHDWGEKVTTSGHALPKLEIGKTYKLEGYETGGFTGIPGEAYRRAGLMIQTTGHYFLHHFVVIKAEPTAPVSFAPWMFKGEKALLSGIAKSIADDSVLVGDGWVVVVKRGEQWEDEIVGKKIESYGYYNPDATWKENPDFARKSFDLIDGWWRLVDLDDQIGRKVSLRGRALSLNGVWWFQYRGTDLYVDGMENLPGWSRQNHGRPVLIEGRLERASLPMIDQISLKPDRDLADYFVVREPSWKPLPALLSPERVLPPQAKQSDADATRNDPFADTMAEGDGEIGTESKRHPQ